MLGLYLFHKDRGNIFLGAFSHLGHINVMFLYSV